MFLLLGGSGVGYSVQKHHVEKLPLITLPDKKRKKRFLINDSIEGWADSIKVLMKSYFFGGPRVNFDFSDIRPRGEILKTSGGKAPGPQPLKECLFKIEQILETKQNGDQLRPIEIHDIICFIANAVLAGGIRRSAMICLFSAGDDEMISCKAGNWWELNPQRGRANNSAVVLRSRITKYYFDVLWHRIKESGSGEPGIFFTNDKDWGTNPCGEIALRPNQFCNLVEIDASSIESQDDLEKRCRAAAFIGTLQASYTDFHYLRPIWQKTTEKDALLGISMTGIASKRVDNLDIEKAVNIIKAENISIAKKIGIRPSNRLTCVKPAGTTSLVLGTSSGIHAWHAEYYIRRMRLSKDEEIYKYLLKNFPALLEDDIFNSTMAVASFPQKAPEGAITRNIDTAITLLNRIKFYTQNWIKPGHVDGLNTHNISATISINDDEWELIREWLWENKECYNGLSFLPHFGGNYVQSPFEECTKEKYEELLKSFIDIDISKVFESTDNTEQILEQACAGGACEL
jgi:ribonucleoside-diphosphate reductase alpha chain